MQCHPRALQGCPGEVGVVDGLASCLEVFGIPRQRAQGAKERSETLLGPPLRGLLTPAIVKSLLDGELTHWR